MNDLYVPRPSAANSFHPQTIDPNRCRVSVYEAVSRNFHQCARAKVVEVDGVGYCAQHDPSAVRRREVARREREAAAHRKLERLYRRPSDYANALRLIANGHNDPRAVATEALTKWGDLEPR